MEYTPVTITLNEEEWNYLYCLMNAGGGIKKEDVPHFSEQVDYSMWESLNSFGARKEWTCPENGSKLSE